MAVAFTSFTKLQETSDPLRTYIEDDDIPFMFGGKDMRTIYVTLSGTGKLIAIDDWAVPGLSLN